jgi:hypothetical protein
MSEEIISQTFIPYFLQHIPRFLFYATENNVCLTTNPNKFHRHIKEQGKHEIDAS